jgi:hypothetical protein
VTQAVGMDEIIAWVKETTVEQGRPGSHPATHASVIPEDVTSRNREPGAGSYSSDMTGNPP